MKARKVLYTSLVATALFAAGVTVVAADESSSASSSSVVSTETSLFAGTAII